MAPSAMSSPTVPTVEPTPAVKLVTVSAGPSPATTPSTADPRISARNGCSFAQVISSTTVAMPSTAARASIYALRPVASRTAVSTPPGSVSADSVRPGSSGPSASSVSSWLSSSDAGM
jgi:hypothetical protein